MEYPRRPEHIAAVITAQSHLHKVRSRSASGDRMIRPLDINVSRCWNEYRSAGAKLSRKSRSLQTSLVSSEEKCCTYAPCRAVHTYRVNHLGADSRLDARSSLNSSNPIFRIKSGGAGLTIASIVSARPFGTLVLRALKMPSQCWQSLRALGKNHILLRLVDVEAKKFFLVSADAFPRKAFSNVAKRTKVDALHKMSVETPDDRIPRLTSLLDGGGQAVPMCSQGSTSNQ